MMKKKMTVLLFALGVLCVLTGVFFLVKSRSAAYEEEQKVNYDTLIDLTANKIARIEWETSDGEKLAFAREGGEWKYEYDEALKVDQEKANLLASGMTGVSVYQVIPDVTDLAPYGLDAPVYKISVTDRDGTTTTVLIGDNNETAGSVYAIYEGEPDTVYSVQPSIKAAVEKKLSDFAG
jgi:hypothetical protein